MNGVRRMIKFITPIKIKTKLATIYSIIVLAVCMVSFFSMKISLKYYDEQLYQSAVDVLNLSSIYVENELKKMASYSYNLVSDKNVQRLMQQINETEDVYEEAGYANELMEKLLIYLASEKYISSIYYYDTEGYQYVDGINPVSLGEGVRKDVIRYALKAKGESFLIDRFAEDGYVLSVRQMRLAQDLSLENIGIVALRLNIQQLMREFERDNNEETTRFMVLSNQNTIYRNSKDEAYELDYEKLVGEQGYFIEVKQGKKYFVSYSKSDYSGWTYVKFMPYNDIFIKSVRIKNIMMLAFLLFFIIGSMVSLFVAKTITKPLVDLTARMKRVEMGDFSTNPQFANKKKDEIGILQLDFEFMIEKIRILIDENYKKQLMITDTQLKALQAQINPHFLYNTLESINWLAKSSGQKQISTMVEALGKLLRNAVEISENLIPIEDEMNLLEAYIKIQKYRYEERLIYRNQMDRRVYKQLIVKLVLQPIVENCIVHSLENMIEPCVITITSKVEGEMIVLRVEDNGLGIDEKKLALIKEDKLEENHKSSGSGIGIMNINQRLKMTFGEAYGLSIDSEIGVGTCVSVKIPFVKAV